TTLFRSQEVRAKLISEASGYIEGAARIGILLSGGMDSRVVAGVLRELQLQSGNKFDVVVLTWGDSKSRDVVYSERISKQFGWDLINFPISAATLEKNIHLAGSVGAEVSPLHFHA